MTPKQPLTYETPKIVELGSIAEVTRGDHGKGKGKSEPGIPGIPGGLS